MMQSEKRLSIAHMIDTTNLGGAERVAVNMINDLHQNTSFQVAMIISREEGYGSALLNSDIPKICLKKNGKFDIAAFVKFIIFLKKQKVDIIHAHTNSVYWSIIAKYFFLPNLHVIWHDHLGSRISSSEKFNKGVKMWGKWIDGYICVSETMLEWAKAHIILEKNKKIYLPNYPELKEPQFSELERFKALKGNVTFLSLANYRVEKEHFTLIKSFKEVLREIPDAKLWLAGKDIQPEYKKQVINLINELGLNDNVIDLGECKEVAALIQSADIGVVSSRFEGLPLSVLELGIYKKPIISTSVGEIPKILGDGKWGALVPPHDERTLAEEMVKLGKDVYLQIKWGRELSEFVNRNYSKNNVIRIVSTYYELFKG
ncbi:MAG: glycosyltransferase [Chitinophagaceae bacterium]|nr:glycosyltransferase [Chitinophagaceae bacterium]